MRDGHVHIMKRLLRGSSSRPFQSRLKQLPRGTLLSPDDGIADSGQAMGILAVLESVGWHNLVVWTLILAPFYFYWYLWTNPQRWVQFCGTDVDPSHRMAEVSLVLKVAQILAVLSAASITRMPPWYCVMLFGVGQFLNYRVYDLLGEAGVYYGVRFGKNIPWVTGFPFGYMKDPQYIGSILSLLGVACWVPWRFVLVWIMGYVFMMFLEADENPATRAKKIV